MTDSSSSLAARFWSYVSEKDANGCRVWSGSQTNGHARFHLLSTERALFDGRRDVSAHLMSWWLTHGSLPRFVDRVCRNTLCVEPSHLVLRTKESRFWRNVDRNTSPEGCWPWKGGKHTFGYGSTAYGSAHRVAYELTHGPIPQGLVVRHTCHNPTCCRPDHLMIGTQKDNIRDAVSAGRMSYARGERIALAKFSDDQAAAIRDVFVTMQSSGKPQNALLDLLSRAFGVTPRTIWRIVKSKSYPSTNKKADGALSETEKARIVEEVVTSLQASGFPWDEIRSRAEKDPLVAVACGKVIEANDEITYVSRAGQATCHAVHLHRYEARYKGQPSVVEAFSDPDALRRAVRFQLDHGDPVTPYRVVRALLALHRAPLNFPPVLARWLVDQYAPRNGTVFDPCSGYGGRLLGACVSANQVAYIGRDVEERSVIANRDLAVKLGVTNRVRQELGAVEDDVDWPAADLVLTSPPYYDREDYGPAARRHLQRYATYREWADGFLRRLVERALAASSVVVLNVTEIRDGAEVYDIPSDVIRYAENAGGRLERTILWRIAAFGKTRRQEKILVIRK